jgi:hypothetical protein
MWPDIVVVLQLAAGLVFLQSSASKLSAPAAFVRGLQHYAPLPNAVLVPTAGALIAAEAVIALSHITGWLLHSALIIASGLLLIFLLVAVFTLLRRREVPCLCFGAGDTQLLSWQSVARLALLILAETFMLWLAGVDMHWQMPYEMDGRSLLMGIASAILLVVTSAWLLSVPQLISLARHCSTCSGPAAAQG